MMHHFHRDHAQGILGEKLLWAQIATDRETIALHVLLMSEVQLFYLQIERYQLFQAESSLNLCIDITIIIQSTGVR